MFHFTRFTNRMLQAMYRPTMCRFNFISPEYMDFIAVLEEKLEEKAALLWE